MEPLLCWGLSLCKCLYRPRNTYVNKTNYTDVWQKKLAKLSRCASRVSFRLKKFGPNLPTPVTNSNSMSMLMSATMSICPTSCRALFPLLLFFSAIKWGLRAADKMEIRKYHGRTFTDDGLTRVGARDACASKKVTIAHHCMMLGIFLCIDPRLS